MSLHIPWNFRSFMEFHGTSQLVIVIPWNSMEFGYVAKFHGTFKILWHSMELLFYVWRFHGIPWNLVLASSSMELSKFHGIPWNFPFDLEKFHGIPWNCETVKYLY